MVTWLPRRGKVGIVEIFGMIGGGAQAASYVKLFNRMKDNPAIKAVVIDIDSPGGLAAASNHLHMAVSRLSAKKPTIAFISGTGASGAYLVGCAATKIIAVPGSIVGSIGVLSARPIVQDLLRKIGVHFDVTKSGELKDMGAFYRDSTEEEKQKEQTLVDSFHRHFVELVARKRHLDEAVVQKLATGEVFPAESAKELGLIDEIGDFETALDLACELGKVPRRVTYAKLHQSMLQRLLSSSASSFAQELLTETQRLYGKQIYYLGPPAI